MRKSIILLLMILLFVTLPLCASPIFTTDNLGFITPPQCKNIYGISVVFVKVPKEFLWTHHISIAMANNNAITHLPTVYVDEDNFPRFSAEFQTFIIFHECAHHALGHIYQLEKLDNFTQIEHFEQDADCQAIKHLVEIGTTNKQFEQIFSDMVDIDLIKMANGLTSKIDYNASYQQALTKREINARSCLSEAKRGEY